LEDGPGFADAAVMRAAIRPSVLLTPQRGNDMALSFSPGERSSATAKACSAAVLIAVAACAAPTATVPQDGSGGLAANRERFLDAHGEFVRAARRQTPAIELTALHVPEGEVRGEPGEFDLTHYRLDATVPIPISRDTFLIAGAHAGARDYEFSRNVVGASDEVLYNAGLRFGAGHFFSDDLVVQGYWQPSIYSDLDASLESEDLKLWYGNVLAVKRASRDWFWKGGLALTDAVDSGVIPLLGFAWVASRSVRVDVLLPRNAEVSYQASAAWNFQLGLELESEEFHVRSTVATGRVERDIHVQDLRAFVGALYRLGDHVSLFAKVGTNVAGHYDWSYLPEPDYDGTLERGLYGQVGVGWSF
jgi:hypothetical protein